MASLNSVKIMEVTRVSPLASSPNLASEFSIPLTLFDAIMFKFSPVERLFFYRLNGSTPSFFNSAILPKLKHSLALALLHYLPVAGNLTWPQTSPKPIILYTPNDGVSFTAAESSADFDSLAHGGAIPAVALHPLVPRLNTSDDKAELLSLQITLFPNQGFSIGQTSHHAALDGNSVTLFMKSWAYICRKIGNDLKDKSFQLPEELTPIFDRSLIKDPTNLDMMFLNQWRELTGSNPDSDERSLKISHQLRAITSDIVRATFKFTPKNIATLRAKILSKIDQTKKQLHLSTYVVVLAYMATCLIRCKQEREEKTVILGCSADFRSRLDPPLPKTYFGNCVGGRGSRAKAGDFTDEKGIAFAAERLSDAVKRVNEGVIEGGEIKVLDLSLPEIFGMDRDSVHVIFVTGSARFGLYGLDFGWGRPEKVDVVSIGRTGAIAMNDSRDEVGVLEGSLALNRQQMETFASFFIEGLKDV